jgi:regulator of RNase E activity RraA
MSLETEILTRAREIGTSTWSDALDEIAVAGVIDGLRHRSGSGVRAGFAATARGEVRPLGTYEAADFGLYRMLDTAGPGRILLVELGGVEVSGMGGVGALAAKTRGIEAVIIDGGCRDADDIAATGLWVASRHVTPRTGKRRVRYGAFGEPATIGGVVVMQGDLVVADSTGVVVIPRAHVEAAMSIAERFLESDASKVAKLRDGKSLA